jgi:GNAT superfamily N-acetyltransferase
MEPAGRADVSVRAARAADAAGVAEVQVTTWRANYAPILPPGALAALETADAEQRWREAVLAPPSPAHRLLVALEDGRAVGFTAVGPGADEDAGRDGGEIFELLVTDGAQHKGHGSRLLAAAVEHLREQAFSRAVTWLFEADEPTVAFYASAGWEPDGSRRTLEMGSPVDQIRLHTSLEPES